MMKRLIVTALTTALVGLAAPAHADVPDSDVRYRIVHGKVDCKERNAEVIQQQSIRTSTGWGPWSEVSTEYRALRKGECMLTKAQIKKVKKKLARIVKAKSRCKVRGGVYRYNRYTGKYGCDFRTYALTLPR